MSTLLDSVDRCGFESGAQSIEVSDMQFPERYSRGNQEGHMNNKKNVKKFDVWVRRDHVFTARIAADTLEEALTIARGMTTDSATMLVTAKIPLPRQSTSTSRFNTQRR